MADAQALKSIKGATDALLPLTVQMVQGAVQDPTVQNRTLAALIAFNIGVGTSLKDIHEQLNRLEATINGTEKVPQRAQEDGK